MSMIRIATVHKKGTGMYCFEKNGYIYLHPTVAAGCGVTVGEKFLLDSIICRFKGHKKIGLIMPKVYDVYEKRGYAEYDEYGADDLDLY